MSIDSIDDIIKIHKAQGWVGFHASDDPKVFAEALEKQLIAPKDIVMNTGNGVLAGRSLEQTRKLLTMAAKYRIQARQANPLLPPHMKEAISDKIREVKITPNQGAIGQGTEALFDLYNFANQGLLDVSEIPAPDMPQAMGMRSTVTPRTKTTVVNFGAFLEEKTASMTPEEAKAWLVEQQRQVLKKLEQLQPPTAESGVTVSNPEPAVGILTEQVESPSAAPQEEEVVIATMATVTPAGTSMPLPPIKSKRKSGGLMAQLSTAR